MSYTEHRKRNFSAAARKAWDTRRLSAVSLGQAQFKHLREPKSAPAEHERMAYYILGDRMVYGKENDAPKGLLIYSTWQAQKIAKEKGLKME